MQSLDKLYYRVAETNDDPCTIGDLLYQSDPYIYPYWFNNDSDEAKIYLQQHFDDASFPFGFTNCFVTYEDTDEDGYTSDSVLGMIIGWHERSDLSYDFYDDTTDNIRSYNTIERCVKPAIYDAQAYPHTLTIFALSVDQNFHGYGIGGRMLEEYLKYMQKTYQIDTVHLTCLADNLRARKFYEAHGFTKQSESIGFDGSDNPTLKTILYERRLVRKS